jgi:hypothetical protein
MLEALTDRLSLNGNVGRLLRRMEISPSSIGDIHNSLRF